MPQPESHATSENSSNIACGSTKQPSGSQRRFPNYPKRKHPRARCNEHKVRGVQINMLGGDELELLVLFPGGFAWEVHYSIDVR